MTSRGFLIGSLLLLLASVTPAAAQSKQQLEKDKAKVEQELKKLSGDLSKAKKNSKNTQQQLQLLDKKISQRTKLINTINGELNLIGIQMERTQDSINLMRTQVDSLKQEYAKVVRVLYGERGNLDQMVLLMDTKSYNTSYLRTKYFRDYSRYRRRHKAEGRGTPRRRCAVGRSATTDDDSPGAGEEAEG